MSVLQQMDRRSRLILANIVIVNREMPGFRFVAPPDQNPYFEGWLPGLHSPHDYQVRLVLPPGSPDVQPDLFVWEPIELPAYGGGTINEKQGGHDWHRLGPGPGGRIQICHSRGWDASRTYLQVLLKGALWLDAYRHHLATGKPISHFFR